MKVRTILMAVVATTALLLASCGGDDDGTPRSTTTSTTSTSAASSSEEASSSETTAAPGSSQTTAAPGTSASTSAPAPEGCTTGAQQPPAGAVSREIVDVDGDGRADTAWIGAAEPGRFVLGITTAAGGGATHELSSAAPTARSALVVDVDGQGPVEILTTDSRQGGLLAFVDCAIATVNNPEGEPYGFDFGLRGTGTGVGCVATDGGQRLVGLLQTGDDGTTVGWKRTVIELDGTNARNGASTEGTYTHPGDDAAIELLHEMTCGEKTIDADGLTYGSS